MMETIRFRNDTATVLQGDCRDILPTLGPVQLVLTDPPYSAHVMGADAATYESGPFVLPEAQYRAWIGTWWPLLERLTPNIVLTPGIGQLTYYPQPKWVLCWHKPSAVSFNRLGGFNAWEPVYIYGKPSQRLGQDYYRLDPRNFLNGPEKAHPCPKPIELMRWLVEHFSNPGDTILDPFAGSGTTLRAAMDCGRKAIGIEMEPKYCDIIIQRLAQSVLSFQP